MSSGTSYFPVLTALRFLAASQVLVFHVGMSYFHAEPSFLGRFFSGGYESVLFFFMLSGFLLTNSRQNDCRDGLHETLKYYYWSRFCRIYPIYLFGLLLALPQFVYSVFVAKIVGFESFVPALLLVPLGMQSWYSPIATAWTIPAWSLSVEISFYLALPFFLDILKKLRMSSANAIVGIAVVLLVGFQAHLYTYLRPLFVSEQSLSNFKTYWPLLFLPVFGCGMLIALYNSRLKLRARPADYVLAFCIALTVLIFFFTELLPTWIPKAILLIPIFALMITAATKAEGPVSKALSSSPLLLLGSSSYALYMIHMPLMFWWTQISLPSCDLKFLTLRSIGFFCAVAVLGSIACYKFIEKPAFFKLRDIRCKVGRLTR